MLAIIEANIIHVFSSADLFTQSQLNLLCACRREEPHLCTSAAGLHLAHIKRISPLRAAQTGKWVILDEESSKA